MQAVDHSCSTEPLHGRPDSMPMITTAEMMQHLESIQELPTLSEAAMRVNAMLMNMDTTARDLAQVIEKDQAMVGKLLKLANSSFFGFSSRVSNVAHAVMLLGFNSVMNAILSMAVIDAFKAKKYHSCGMDLTAFWRHAIAVAVISRFLSRAVGGQRNENAFTAGILHDIGKLVMAVFFTERFIGLRRMVDAGEASFLEAERCVFPMGHAPVGAFLARCWNLPEDLATVISQHHQPGKLPPINNLVELVHVADAIVNIHLENNGPQNDWPICHAAWQLLGEKLKSVDKWLPEVKEEIEAACGSILED